MLNTILMTLAVSASPAQAEEAEPVELNSVQMDAVTAGAHDDLPALHDAAANVGALTPVFLVDAGDGGKVRTVQDEDGGVFGAYDSNGDWQTRDGYDPVDHTPASGN